MNKKKLKKQNKKLQQKLNKAKKPSKPKSTNEEIKGLQKQLSSMQKKTAKAKANAKKIKANAERDRMLGDALSKAGASKGASKMVKMFAANTVKTDSGKKPLVNLKKGTFRNAKNGEVLTRKNGKPFKVSHYLQHLQKKEGIEIFKGSKGSGSKGGSKSSGKSSHEGLYRSEMSPKKQVKFIKKHSKDEFDKLPNTREKKKDD